jgi:hypothetical protein
MVVIEIAGMPGEGKTLFATYCALKFHELGYRIYSNYKIFNPITGDQISKNIETQENLENAHDGYLILDEIAQYIDGRKAMTGVSKLVNNVLQKNRKRKLSLLFTCQDAYMVDVRLRLNSDYVVLPYQHYVINGQEATFKQNLFNPVNTNLLLKYSQIHADMLPAGKFFGKKDYTKYDVVQEFDILVEPISKCYDTSEEIEDLVHNGRPIGDIFEAKCLEKLQDKFPHIKWYLTENSGKDQMTYDIEGTYEDKTWIIDCVKSLSNPRGENYYINMGKKNIKKYKEVEELRHAKTFTMFDLKGKLYTLPMDLVYNNDKKSISITPLLEAGKLEFISKI